MSENGISTDPEKVRAVADWPTPTTLREVRSFVGLCSYNRRFVEGFARIYAPLHDMTKKGRTFCWTPECQEAFERLKSALTSAPALAMPDKESVFVLDTDAAQTSIGAVVSQRQQGVERVVAYASRKLSKCEINYCVTRMSHPWVTSRQFFHYRVATPFYFFRTKRHNNILTETPSPNGASNANWGW